MVESTIWQRRIIAAVLPRRAAVVLPMTLLLTSCTRDPPVRSISLVGLAVAIVLIYLACTTVLSVRGLRAMRIAGEHP